MHQADAVFSWICQLQAMMILEAFVFSNCSGKIYLVKYLHVFFTGCIHLFFVPCTCILFSDMMQQGIDLSVKPHIVISTPGRLADHIESCNTFSFKKIKFLVIFFSELFIIEFTVLFMPLSPMFS